MNESVLEVLAKEITTIGTGKGKDYSDLIYNIRNNEYPREELIRDLINNQLKYFAGKLHDGYYERQNKLEKEINAKANN